MAFKMKAKKIIGIDLGGTSTKFAIADLEGTILQNWSIPTDKSEQGELIVPNMIKSMKHRLALYQMKIEDIFGIGLGSPGKVDSEKGSVVGAYNLNWTTPKNVCQIIQNEIGIRPYIENDANVAALGERWKGAGNNEDNMVFITLGTGVGGGVINDGKIIRGNGLCAGEIGHLIVDPEGIQCTCGNKGCLETICSATGIVNLARLLSEEYSGESELLASLNSGQEITSKDIFTSAKEGDKFAQYIVKKICFNLGIACANIANILNPAKIVLGGGVAMAGEYLRQQVEDDFKKFVFPPMQKSTTICLAELGNEAGVLGAIFLPINARKQ